MRSEILEIFNDNFESIGQSNYDEVHANGYWHQVIHCWIIDSVSHTILYQKRGLSKIIYPNMLDVSAAGHCRFNESPLQTLIRETLEEIGIIVNEERLIKVGIRRDAFMSGERINREFQHVFFYQTNFKEEKIRIQNKELQYVVLIKPSDVIHSIENRISIRALRYDKGIFSETMISASEFIPSVDNYNLKIPIAISNYLSNKIPIYF
jgi:isopentenyldiphosphate isomerase